MKKVLVGLLIGVATVGLFGCSSKSEVVGETPKVETKEEVEERIKIDAVKEEKEEVVEEVIEDDGSIKEGKVDLEPRVIPEELPFAMTVLEPDSIGTVYGNLIFQNNSKYIITAFDLTALDNVTNEKTYYCCYDTVMQGETSPIMESFASDDISVLKLEYTIYDKESGLSCHYEYDTKLERVQWTAWYKAY